MQRPAIVLIQGAWGSSASWSPVADLLRQAGHTVFAPSLTGLGERRHLFGGHINLSTHVADVEGLIEAEGLARMVLVGHSYGGMVTTAVADRMAERIDGLVYLDAFLPGDDQSVCDLIGMEAMHANLAQAGEGDGIGVPPPLRHAARVPHHLRHYMDQRSPQPLATMIERVRLTGAAQTIARRHYVSATIDQAPVFQRAYASVKDHPDWSAQTIACGHMLQLENPDEVAAIIASFSDRCRAGEGQDGSS